QRGSLGPAGKPGKVGRPKGTPHGTFELSAAARGCSGAAACARAARGSRKACATLTPGKTFNALGKPLDFLGLANHRDGEDRGGISLFHFFLDILSKFERPLDISLQVFLIGLQYLPPIRLGGRFRHRRPWKGRFRGVLGDEQRWTRT